MDEEKNVGQDGSELKDKAQQGADKAKSAVNNLTSLPGKAEAFAANATKVANTARKANHVKTAAAATKAAAAATKVAAISSSIVSFLWPIVLIILILFITIGLITFLLSGMGFIWNGIQQVAHDIGNAMTSLTEGDEFIIEPEQIEDTMNYLVSLDYDLYGYGFVEDAPKSKGGWTYDISGNTQTDDNGNEVQTESSAGTVTLDRENYKSAIGENWLFKGEDRPNPFRYLTAYLIADNYSNLVKADNFNFKSVFKSWDGFWSGFFGDTNDWGSGLISAYYEKGNKIGKKGNAVEGWRGSGFVGTTVKVNNGKLVVSTGGSSNIKFKYDMDGWVGRYGMPLEFLLSTHVATMAPDLSFKLATSFNTDVELLLHKSDKDKTDSNGENLTQIKAGVVLKSRDDITDPKELTADEGKDKNIITKDDIEEVLAELPKNVKLTNINRNNVMFLFNKFHELGLVSPEGCLGTDGDSFVNIKGDSSEGGERAPEIELKISLNNGWMDYEHMDTLLDEENNAEIDTISNLRKSIEAIVIDNFSKAVNTSYGDAFINMNNPIIEISPDVLKKIQIEDYDISEIGEIEGNVKNEYTFSSDFTGMGSGTDKILNGNYQYSDDDDSVQKYIHDSLYDTEKIKTEDMVKVETIRGRLDEPIIDQDVLQNYTEYIVDNEGGNRLWHNGTIDSRFMLVDWDRSNNNFYNPSNYVKFEETNTPPVGDYNIIDYGSETNIWDCSLESGWEFRAEHRDEKNEPNEFNKGALYIKTPKTWSYYRDKHLVFGDGSGSYCDGDDTWGNLNFVTVQDSILHTRRIDAEAELKKPVLIDNSNVLSWSFINEVMDGVHSYITISVRTEKPADLGSLNIDISKDEPADPEENKEMIFDIYNYEDYKTVKYTVTPTTGNDMGNLYIDFTITKKNDSYKPNATSSSSTEEENENLCSSIAAKYDEQEIIDNKDIKCCDICYNYLKQINKALNTMAETEMETFVPYINRVTDHWFRNVYFTKDALDETNKEKSENGEEQDNIIRSDDAYEEATGERWTLYDTYEDENGDVQYELYVFLKDGSGEFKTSFEKSGDSYIVCKRVSDGSGKYIVDDDGTTYKLAKDENGKSIKGEFKLQLKSGENSYSDYGDTPEEFRVGKRAILNEDIPTDWKAYSADEVQHDTGWQMLDPSDEDKEELNSDLLTILEDYKDLTLVSRAKYLTVEQKEDGLRGETNAKVKNIFLDQYYIFDGSIERASAIENVKNKVYKQRDSLPKGVDYNNPKALELLGMDTKNIINIYGKPKNYTLKDISGNISIAQESLNAFAMLKNMKTLDAEYIYHDFKELIVELNYFDKEDLLEGEQTVMMFPVAGINSEGWVDAKNDKNPTYYGTLIHSAEDYLAFDDIEAKENGEELDKSKEEEDNQYKRIGNGSSENYHKNTFIDTAKACWEHVVDKKYSLLVPQDNIVVTVPLGMKGKIDAELFVSWVIYEYGYESFAGYAHSFGRGGLAGNENELKKYGWDYKLNTTEDISKELKAGDILINGDHAVIVSGISGKDDEIKILGYDCSSAGNWSIENKLGVDVTSMATTVGIEKHYIRIDASKEIVGYEGFEGGEPVIAPVSGQIIDYGTTERTNIETGEKEDVGFIKIRVLDDRDLRFVEEHQEPTSEGDSARLFLKNNYSKEDLEKLGFDYFEQEYFDAGISGHVLYLEGFDINKIKDYKGSSKTNNTDIDPNAPKTKADTYDTVSAAVGGADGGGSLQKSDLMTQSGKEPTGELSSSLRELERGSTYEADTTNNKNAKVGNSKSDTYTSNREGNSIVKNEDNIEQLVKYIKDEDTPNNYKTLYEVPNMLNNTAEFKLKVHEEAKKMADFIVEVDGKYYIKEGAVIGYTYEPGVTTKPGRDAKPEKDTDYQVGNYLRLILRDLKDEVVETVENYVETSNNLFTGNITEQFIYWMAFTSEGALVGSKGQEYYKSEDIGDGVGNSGPFGLTVYCDGIAASIGYDKFGEHRLDGNVPLDEGDDVFVAALEVEKEDVLFGLGNRDLLKKVNDYIFLALVDLRHAGPVMLNDQLDKFKTNGFLTKKDFEDNWGTATQFATGLQGRAKRRGILAYDELYTAGNNDSGYQEVIWLTPTPWSDYLKEHDNNGYQFGGKAIMFAPYDPD